jgi:hypothetical protein
MRSKPLPLKSTPGERVAKDIRRATRRRQAAERAGVGGARPYVRLLVTTPIRRSLRRVDALRPDGNVATVVSVRPAAVAIMEHVGADQHGAGGQRGEDHADGILNAMATRAM